jgi:hypothetical protein
MGVLNRMQMWLKGKPRPAKVTRQPVPFGHTGGGATGHLFDRNLAQRFVYEGQVVYVQSSNVDKVQFDLAGNKMRVWYGDGGYEYSNVTVQEAISFIQARSKGRWIWSNIRVRGSKTAHRKPFRPL